jgi:hypothetical protein
MTIKKFNLYTEHIWKMREYLTFCEQFDYPWYGGLKSKFEGSPEACDAFQNIWNEFINGQYKTKNQFKFAYKTELKRLGENVKG